MTNCGSQRLKRALTRNFSPLQREIFEQLLKLQEMEKLDPKGNNQDKITFLRKFLWEKSALNDEQKAVGELLASFSDIFAKYRFDVGYNTDLKKKLTPESRIPIYWIGIGARPSNTYPFEK